MSQAPTDMLAARHKPYRQAQERYRRATAAREAAQQRVSELEQQLVNAETRDRVQLGDALVDGRKPPAGEAEPVLARLEAAKREAAALAYAEQRAPQAVDELPRTHKTAWLQHALSDLAKHRDSYEAAIRSLAAARDLLADQATLVAFLEYGQQTQPIGAALRTIASDGSSRAYDFGQLVELMLVEAATVEDTTMLDPSRPRPEPAFHLVHRAVGVNR